MNRNSRLLIVLAVALAGRDRRQFRRVPRARQQARGAAAAAVATLVAAQAIPAGTMVTRDMSRSRVAGQQSRLTAASAIRRSVIDRGAIVAIAANEPITESKLAPGAGGGLPPTIPPGMRAISVRVNEVIGVAGFVVPGTRVDVIVTLRERTQASESSRASSSRTSRCSPPARATTRRRRAGRPADPDVGRHAARDAGRRRAHRAGAAEGRITLTLRNPLDTAPTESAASASAG